VKFGGATHIAAGDAFTLAVGANGQITGWGGNADGALNAPLLKSAPRSIAAGNAHAVAARADGSVVAWGSGTSGQLAVPAGLDRVERLVCSSFATIALRDDGTVVSWGGGANPANGPAPTPASVTGLTLMAAKGSVAVGVRGATDPGPTGDLNGDGIVSAADLAILLSSWGASGGPADLNGDGQVNAADLATLLAAWG
jgi:hypothetical protein